MPEEHWQSHGGIPACDLCHSRKVKCDRKDPCKNCVVANAQCLRTRTKRTPRPQIRTDDKIRALVERLATLEGSVQPTQAPSRASSAIRDSSAVDIAPSTSTPVPLKRKRSIDVSSDPTTLPTPEAEISYHQANGARILVEQELSSNGMLSANQRTVLETARSFVDQISQVPLSTFADSGTWSRDDVVDVDLSASEIIHAILGCQAEVNNSVAFKLHTIDHIPPKAFEKIGLALLQGDADEQTQLLYTVIAHFKCAVLLCRRVVPTSPRTAVEAHVKKAIQQHVRAALAALGRVSFLTAPSLLLVQALITGAMLMQVIGDPCQCWSLTASASRALVALGYHNLRSVPAISDAEEEIHAALAFCCHLDKSMGVLLLRPPSLPKLHVAAAELIKPDCANPMSRFVIAFLEMTPINEEILEMMLERGGGPMCSPICVEPLREKVNSMRSRMADIYASMAQLRPSHDPNDIEIEVHWRSLEFKYYSILTTVHRLSPTVTSDRTEREECLRCARRALECVNLCQRLGFRDGQFSQEYSPFLTWMVISYPLTPFFVVFCNVVGTSNTHDFKLLQDVTESISSLTQGNRYVNRLHRLCVMLVELCKPLVEPVSAHSAHNMSTPDSLPLDHQDPNNTAAVSLDASVDFQAMAESEHQCCGVEAGPWDDNMMWQLFQSQPSLDWFNADVLDSI